MAFIDGHYVHEDEGHYVELRLDFFEGDETDEDGDPLVTLGQCQVHVHGVPAHMYVDTLLILAREAVEKNIEVGMFSDDVPQEVRDMAARMLASQWLGTRAQSAELVAMAPVSANVPDDASSLLE